MDLFFPTAWILKPSGFTLFLTLILGPDLSVAVLIFIPDRMLDDGWSVQESLCLLQPSAQLDGETHVGERPGLLRLNPP